MIALEQVRFHYGGDGFALHVDRLDAQRGERVALVGPSGCGKTTLLHVIAGILPVEHGSVCVGDVELHRLGDAARRAFRIRHVGLVFQQFELIEYLTVGENILLPYLINGALTLDAEVRASAAELAASLGLGQLLKRPIDRLSHGERQRAAIARALLPQPALLLADEPTGNLDPANKRRTVELLLEHTARRNATLLMVTHDHGLVDDFDRVVDVAQFAAGAVSMED